MDLSPPTAEVAQSILLANAHRFPQRAKIPVLGDGGARQNLPIIIGVPSGACRMPSGARVAPVWRAIVEGLIHGKLDAPAMADRLVEDCLLWPDQKAFAVWRSRWPAIGSDVGLAVFRMVGTAAVSLSDPSAIDEQPDEVAAALDAHPRAVWRHMRPPGASFEAVIEAPDSVRYDAYSDAIRRPDGDAVALCREFAEAQVVFCSAKPAEVFDRFPGLTVLVAAEARSLGGASGEVTLGEW